MEMCSIQSLSLWTFVSIHDKTLVDLVARYLATVIISQRFSLISTNANDAFPSFAVHQRFILLIRAFAFRQSWELHDTWRVIDNNNDAIVCGKEEESLCIQRVKKGEGKNWKEWEKREAEKGKVARWRGCHRLNTPTRDPERQGVSPAWNAAGACWRTTPLSILSLSLFLFPRLFPLFPFSHPIISSHYHFNPIGSHSNESLLLHCFKKYSVQFKRRVAFTCLESSLSLSLSFAFVHSCRTLSFRTFHLRHSLCHSLLNRLHFNIVPLQSQRQLVTLIVGFNEYRLTFESKQCALINNIRITF